MINVEKYSRFRRLIFGFIIMLTLFISNQSAATNYWNGTTYTIEIPNGGVNGFLQKAQYSIFVPKGVEFIKGILIHQHGCTMEGTGEPIVTDAQYQAFAKKWSLVILAPDLYPKDGKDCYDWRNPEDGSGPSLLAALNRFSELTGHLELNKAPWLLWGHSGGGYWVLNMTKTFPERIIATFAYSPAFDPDFNYPEAVNKIPVMIRHAGAADFNDPGGDCWATALHTFSKLRARNGLISVAYNAHQNHNLSYVRLMALPFFESVLAQRLSKKRTSFLRDMDASKAWLCDTITSGEIRIYKASKYQGDILSKSWLPDSVCASKFREYLKTGTVKDITPPPAPMNLKLKIVDEKSSILTWEADADIESGIKYFNVYIEEKLLGRYPEKDDFQTFDTNGDNPHPAIPAEMRYQINRLNLNPGSKIALSTVNREGLESAKSTIVINKNQIQP